MKNYLQQTVDEIKAIVPLTESQEQDVKNQLYDLIVRLQRPINHTDNMNIEEITDGDFSFKISSDNPIYQDIIERSEDERL